MGVMSPPASAPSNAFESDTRRRHEGPAELVSTTLGWHNSNQLNLQHLLMCKALKDCHTPELRDSKSSGFHHTREFLREHNATSGQPRETALVRLAGYVRLSGAWPGNLSGRAFEISCCSAMQSARETMEYRRQTDHPDYDAGCRRRSPDPCQNETRNASCQARGIPRAKLPEPNPARLGRSAAVVPLIEPVAPVSGASRESPRRMDRCYSCDQ